MADEAAYREEIQELRRQLEEAEQTLTAIRQGEVDAVVVEGSDGDQVYTLRTAEQPYRRLVEQMQDGAVTLTQGGDIAYCNRRFGELVNSPVERIVGSPIEDFIVPEDRPLIAGMLGARRGTWEAQLNARGERVPVCLSVSAFVSNGVESLCLVVTDVRELLQARYARAQAEAASRAKDEFIAMLGHELRNPLGAITSAITVLRQLESGHDHGVQAREVIARQTEQLTRVIEDLLDVIRVALGKIILTRAPVDLASAVERGIATL